MRALRAMRTARSMVWSSSRTLPGQAWCSIACSAVGSKPCNRAAIARGVAGEKVRGESGNVFAALAQGGRADLDCVEAEEQVFAEAAGGALRVQVGVGGGEHAHVDRLRPRGADALDLAGLEHAQELGLLAQWGRWRSRRGRACRHCASSKRPMRSVRASVKAPLTWPKSSLSKVPSGSAPVLTATRVRSARAESRCSVCATTSLPVPCSPVMRTFASDGPTRAISSSTGRMDGAEAMNAGAPGARRMRFSASSHCARLRLRCNSICVFRTLSRRAFSQGFWMKSPAPRRIASTASSMLPQAVMTTTGSCESISLTRETRSRPSWPEVVSRV